MVEMGTAQGCLFGLACGDALGRPVEFKSAAEIEARHGTVDEMLGYSTHGQPPGTITDDTELALRIARSLVSTGGFDGADVAARFVSWNETGPFDIGLLTADVLDRLQAGEQWDRAGRTVWASRPERRNAGNGSVLRCDPYALAFTSDERHLGQVSERSSAITHADPRCKRGCAILTLTIAAILRGEGTPLARALNATYPGQSTAQELATAVDGLPNEIPATEMQNGGYVVDALQAGLYYALDAKTAEEAIVRALTSSHEFTRGIPHPRARGRAGPDRRRGQVPDHRGRSRFADSRLAPSGVVSSGRRGRRRRSSTTGGRSPRGLFCPRAAGRAIGRTRVMVPRAAIRAGLRFGDGDTNPTPGFPIALAIHSTPNPLILAVGGLYCRLDPRVNSWASACCMAILAAISTRLVLSGGDTDTVGAITGAVAGATFGDDALPQKWLDAIDESDELRQLAQELTEVSVPDGETG